MNKVFLGVVILTLAACNTAPERLPIYGPREVNMQTVDGRQVADTLYQTIPDFTFVDQAGDTVTAADFADKVFVADFFFTSCQTICPVMSKEMLRVYGAFRGNPSVAILSHSIDPGYDSVAVLRDYAERLGVADNQQWHFVTGSKEDIFRMSQQSYLVPVMEDPSLVDGLDHSGKFILIDKARRIRGYYSGTDPADVDRLIKDMGTLLNEENVAS